MKVRKNKIFFISTEYPPAPGGIGTHAFSLLEEMRLLGWETIVATNQEYVSDDEITEFNEKQNYPLLQLKTSLSMIMLIKKMFFLIRQVIKHNPDVIMGSGRHASYFAYACAIVTFKKCVLVGHGTEFIMKLSLRSAIINKWVYSKAYSIIYVSKFTKKLAEENGIHNKRPEVLYNGANDNFFKVIQADSIAKFKAETGIEKQQIIITTGTLSARKGQEIVVRAMPKIVKKYPKVHYYSIGIAESKLLNKLENICTEFGITNHVHFLGRQTNSALLNWLNAADIYVLPSTVVNAKDVEGFGISVIEAALCQKPAVVADQSGAIESIESGVTGLVAVMGSPDSMADKICELLANDSMRLEMGKNALDRAKDKFTWRKATFEYHKYLLKLLNK